MAHTLTEHKLNDFNGVMPIDLSLVKCLGCAVTLNFDVLPYFM